MELTSATLAAVRRLIARHQRFLVTSHVRPDGDAYGSTLAFGLVLRALGKEVLVTNSDGLMPAFQFLPGSETLVAASGIVPEADRALIAVDCAEQKRLGPECEAWGRAVDLNLDHHLSNPGYGTLNLLDATAPATAELLFDLIQQAGWPLSTEIATNLYVGIMTDTGSFRYRQTSSHTLAVAGQLVAAGADPTELAQSCFQSFAVSRLRLLREVLGVMRFAYGDRVAWFVLEPGMFARSGATTDETEGLIEHLQAIKSVEVAFLLEVLPNGLTRASLRSRGAVNVAAICQELGGGGHRLAAGLRTRLGPSELEPRLLALVAKQLPNAPA